MGARLMVDNGSALAVIFHVPEAVIGLTIVAIGTSLPELVTTIMALIKKMQDYLLATLLVLISSIWGWLFQLRFLLRLVI